MVRTFNNLFYHLGLMIKEFTSRNADSPGGPFFVHVTRSFLVIRPLMQRVFSPANQCISAIIHVDWSLQLRHPCNGTYKTLSSVEKILAFTVSQSPWLHTDISPACHLFVHLLQITFNNTFRRDDHYHTFAQSILSSRAGSTLQDQSLSFDSTPRFLRSHFHRSH